MSYLPHTSHEREEMLKVIGVSSMEDLFANVPNELRSGPPQIPKGLSEMEVQRLIDSLAEQNQDLEHRPSFLGAGAYHHYVPSVVGAMTGRSEFYTSYTPYQPEVSQGTLQVIYEYQTMIAELTGLDVSNASLYDASTATAEAATIAFNETGRHRLVVAGAVHPEYRAVLQTYTRGQGFSLTEVPEDWVLTPELLSLALDDTVAGVVVQSPNFFGALEQMAALTEVAHQAGALLISINNPLSLALISTPGQFGADIAVGCGQPLGIPLQYGGPYLGYIATRSHFLRRLPGRIAGAASDKEGRRGFVLTLQAREQHIRREKATSNICTNHALMALAATVYMSLMGRVGLRELAELCLQRAHYAAREISRIPGFELAYASPFFNEFTVRTPVPAAEVNRFLLSRGIIGGFDLGKLEQGRENYLVLAVTEMNDRREIEDLVTTLSEITADAEQTSRGQLEGTVLGGSR